MIDLSKTKKINSKTKNKKVKTKKKANKKTVKKKIKQNNRNKNFSNVLNVGRYVRKNTKFKVSPTFVKEIKSYLKVQIEHDVSDSERIAKSERMKTLQEHHIIRAYDFRMPNRNRMVNCKECGKCFVICQNDADKYSGHISCPFCGKKRGISIE